MGEFSGFQGQEVEQVWVWYPLRLVFDLGPPGEPGIYIDVSEFQFTDSDGRVHDINVELDPVAAGVVLGLLRHRVTEATVVSWELRLTFDTGAKIVCPPHESWEAWTASLPDGTVINCPPGGGQDSP